MSEPNSNKEKGGFEAKIYSAPKPRYSDWEWFKFIAVRTVFPPVLLWDLIKFGANKLFGEWVGGLIVGQTSDLEQHKITDNKLVSLSEELLILEKLSVITHDKANLDTLEVKHESQENIDSKNQKYIINLVGNGMGYELIVDDMKKDARELKVNVVGFNLRGVGQSTGKAKSSDDLVIDGIAQVQRLINNGVSPENITLKGFSLGGGVASLVAQHFHQIGQPINIFNNRSFSSITNFVVGHIRLDHGNHDQDVMGPKESIGGVILGSLAKPFIKFGVALVKWEINAGSAFKSIPEENRDYIVARSTRSYKKNGYHDDTIIPHYASIHKELTSERGKKKSVIDKEIKRLDNAIEQHPGNNDLSQKKKEWVKDRDAIKGDRKMMTKEQYAHNARLESLENRSNKNAQDFFKEFVQRTKKDHGLNESQVTAQQISGCR